MGHPGCAGSVPGPGARASDSVGPAPCLVTDRVGRLLAQLHPHHAVAECGAAWASPSMGLRGCVQNWPLRVRCERLSLGVPRVYPAGKGLHLGIGGLSGPNLTTSPRLCQRQETTQCRLKRCRGL